MAVLTTEHPDSYNFIACPRGSFVIVFSLVLIIKRMVEVHDEESVEPCSKADVCPSFCLSCLPDDCGSVSPTANMKVVCLS